MAARLFGSCMLRRSANESSYEYVDMSKWWEGDREREREQADAFAPSWQQHFGTIKKTSIKAPKK